MSVHACECVGVWAPLIPSHTLEKSEESHTHAHLFFTAAKVEVIIVVALFLGQDGALCVVGCGYVVR